MPIEERRSELAGISTVWIEAGNGPSMVLLHGPGAYGASWMRVLPALARTYRVVAPDLPGHGASTMPSEPLDAERVLRWLGELVEHTSPEPPVIVGQLVGGAIAARFALDSPERVGALVLVVPFGLAPFEPTPEFGAALGAYLAGPDEETHDELWRRCVFDLDGLRSGLGTTWDSLKAYNLDLARTPTASAAMGTMLELFGAHAIPERELDRIAVPTTLVWGRNDHVVPLSTGEAASRRYGWPLHVVDGAGNEPALEAPEAFLRALGAALGARQEVTA
jgi:pimeloyl-ACP methyl ester carboxylesterase